jgi:hypothetical protein
MCKQKGLCEVEFRYLRPDAEEVYLVSDFNGWDPYSLAMARTAGGDWACRVKLHRGIYRFTPLVILASGEWSVDRATFVLDLTGPEGKHFALLGDQGNPETDAPMTLAVRSERSARARDRFRIVAAYKHSSREEAVL